MARPTKQGVDYFPVDVQFDDNVELFIAECGAGGLGILITIWQLIYRDKGYYTHIGDDLTLLIRRRTMSEVEDIENTINTALKRDIFDREKFEEHEILTSKGIQKRYLLAAKKKKIVDVNENYLCEGVSVGENVIYSTGNATKEKKGKSKGRSKGKEKKKKFDPILFRLEWIPEDLWEAFLENRKEKKLSNSKLALTTITNALFEATQQGYTVERCIGQYVSGGWKRFDVEWMKNKGNSRAGPIQPRSVRDACIMANDQMADMILTERENEQTVDDSEAAYPENSQDGVGKPQVPLP